MWNRNFVQCIAHINYNSQWISNCANYRTHFPFQFSHFQQEIDVWWIIYYYYYRSNNPFSSNSSSVWFCFFFSFLFSYANYEFFPGSLIKVWWLIAIWLDILFEVGFQKIFICNSQLLYLNPMTAEDFSFWMTNDNIHFKQKFVTRHIHEIANHSSKFIIQ